MELKTVIKSISSRNWRCHRRRVFYQRLFKDILSKSECRNLAGEVSYFPFELIKQVPIGKVSPDFSDDTKAIIYRISPVWKLLFGFGEFGVTINDTNFQKRICLW